MHDHHPMYFVSGIMLTVTYAFFVCQLLLAHPSSQGTETVGNWPVVDELRNVQSQDAGHWRKRNAKLMGVLKQNLRRLSESLSSVSEWFKRILKDIESKHGIYARAFHCSLCDFDVLIQKHQVNILRLSNWTSGLNMEYTRTPETSI